MNKQDGIFSNSFAIKPRDAKYKICPFINEHSKFIGKTIFNCVGPECMAWDWRKWKETKPKTPANAYAPRSGSVSKDVNKSQTDKDPKIPTHGTCALVFPKRAW